MFLSTFVVARLGKFVDPRWIVTCGLILTAFSGWQMAQFDLQMDAVPVMWSGVVQGCGISAVFVPLAGVAFATLSPTLRNEGAAIFSLARNLGSSIGVSIVETVLTRNTQIVHASLTEHLTPFSALVRAQINSGAPTMRSLSALNAQVTEQAAMIAYNDDFKLMMWLSLAALPLVLVLRKAGGPTSPEHVAAE
jgi:DHA2 family multidrug resistance protein